MRTLKYLLIAMLLIGCTSVFGQDEQKFTPEKVKDIIRRAEQGGAIAQGLLGLLYDLGNGVPKDAQLALKWYKLPAAQGDAGAQYNLGRLYHLGNGVPKDYVLAYKWYNLAAAQEYEIAAEFRDELAKEMNTSQIQEAQRLAREFKPKKEKP